MLREGLEGSSSAQVIPGVRNADSLVVRKIVDVVTEGKCPPAGGGSAAVELLRAVCNSQLCRGYYKGDYRRTGHRLIKREGRASFEVYMEEGG